MTPIQAGLDMRIRFPAPVRLLAVLPFVAVAACGSSATEPENITVAVQANVDRPAVQPPFVVTRAAREVTVRGTFAARCVPAELTATALRDGGVLEVTVFEADGECTTPAGESNYIAVVSGLNSLPSGVRVVHSWVGDDRDDEVVFQGTFQ